MTFVRDKFFRPIPVEYDMPRRGKLVGQLLQACVALNAPFAGELQGWRVVIAPVTEHREMTKGDLDA